MSGIYIHWPYCLSKCPYCDFYSSVDKNINQGRIIDSYIEDLNFYKEYMQDEVKTIFFGGGTPSLIEPQYIEKLINHIYTTYNVKKNIEISLEANPNSNYKNMFMDLRLAGINRLSLGVQSLNEQNLRFLGRTHNKAQAFEAIDEVLHLFCNNSMDIMLGLPEAEDIEQIKSLGFKHLSIYQLTIEEGTAFYKQGLKELSETKAKKLYKNTQEILKDTYHKYEVSNFAQSGFECQHNLGYWQGEDYVGVGNGAHGRLNLFATTHHRQMEKLSPEERAQELVLMGLRITQGVDKNRFKSQCGLDFDAFINQKNLSSLISQGLIYNDSKNIKATDKGSYLLNKIILELVDNI